ncbi:tRNA synthetases class I (C) catalytic domain-containing protein [Geopyxis carbonaria]|nr:tRNA synthetases class I (C) catalytic domain-containing protein [Geopyxis carbonaria]
MAAATPARRELPPWSVPPRAADARPLPPLSIYNTFTRKKEPFVPLDPAGRKATWYCCGPTVYDAAHLGHARNYVTTDVLRRIMRDYFGYEVQFVQNVTDVDDKIILRARQQYLRDEYTQKNPAITPEVAKTVREAWDAYIAKNLASDETPTPETFEAWATKYHAVLMKSLEQPQEEVLLDEAATKTKMHLNTALTAVRVLNAASSPATDAYYAATSAVLLPYLDKLNVGREYGPEVFSKLSQYWENHFNEDMATLNVLPPTATTRVSEFIPENVAFVEKLVQKGFAYPTADGSVYFDIAAYEAAGHHYAKLQPWNVGNEGLIADGEGALTSSKASTLPDTSASPNGWPAEKKSKQDFALWKAWRAGEPGWPSPWGKGRPGWHIECSVMCSAVLGSQVDIHSGGIDLAFPHHDNEIAQSEAYWSSPTPCAHTADGKHQWINYFLHMGHLQIHGSKMSKSLKNFVSVRAALGRGGGWTARGLRIVFLMGGWKDGIEVREGVLAEARNWEATVTNFFTNVKALVAEEAATAGAVPPQPWTPLEAQLQRDLDNARTALDAALCDSFNTPAAMQVLADLISAANIYTTKTTSLPLVKECARWVTRIVTIFGLDASSTPGGADRIGWSDSSASAAGAASTEEAATPFVRLLSSFRSAIRAHAIANPTESSPALLAMCDTLRDTQLPELGVVLDDRDVADGKPALIKFVPAEQLRAERDEKERVRREKEEKKEAARRKREEDEARKREAAKVDPRQMFRTEEWGEWDDEGVPTRDAKGEEVTKSKRKTLVKAWERQRKLFEAGSGKQA